MTHWKLYKLGELANYINGGAWPATAYSTTKTTVPIVRVTNVINFSVDLSSCKYLKEAFKAKYIKHKLEEGDLIVCTVGSHPNQQSSVVGKTAFISEKAAGAYLNQNAVLLRAREELLDKKYLGVLSRSLNFKEHVESNARGSANQVRIAISSLLEMDILLPPIQEQTLIAEVLSTFDDKIELNRRMNQTLEQMAQTFYRHYFMDGIDADNLPEGWKNGTIGKIHKTTSGGTPSRAKAEYYGGGIPWVKSKELNGSFILKTEETITTEGLKGSSAKLLPAQSVLVAMYGATVGEIAVLNIGATCNQAICAIIPNENYPYTFIFEFLKIAKGDLINRASGSAQQNISQVVIQNFPLIIPPVDRIAEFHEKVDPLYEKIILNEKENYTLTNLRDTLLPKLMFGEIDVTQTQPADAYEEVLS